MAEDILNFSIESLGERTIPSPVLTSQFTPDDKRVLFNIGLHNYNAFTTADGRPLSLEVAGPREKIFFDPVTAKAAIVTCGGLCPGINDVIRAIVMGLYHRYGVRNIIGIRYGFQGLIPKYGHEIRTLTPEAVQDIHTYGGSILSSSRGKQNIVEMVTALKRMNVDLFFCIGGDGTMRAAGLIAEEVLRRNLNISVIGIPKTIDNDLNLIEKTFGFDTAISEAVKAVQSAHVEAKGAPMGIGLVKLMGRQSGHIAVGAALAQNDVNIVLIPEVPFDLEGEKGFLKTLEDRLQRRKHCVILVAEGAGQELMRKSDTPLETDASGNLRLLDIGTFLRMKIEEHFKKIGVEINLKYIDPSYMIRSVRANAGDSIYCGALGLYAVHAGMAGKTGMLVGLMRDEYVHIPIKMVTFGKKVDTDGNTWQRVLESTGQPSMKNDE
ncbi:MAG TPA: ATP-dependent 6-phosphofructokinase [Syntrophales bacterium]|jgi:6-phosphofructokinase 1|nr:ATP-dependent 6-phosphofructokinase [Syntrophales bacterium]HPX56051.1 ATP-dependent 6-phosphofructokinase [Syntrophales bacterium]HQA83185.1 ATP-dependent 6-phosphofructokinase [Syntrophales bacterium]